MVNKFNLKISIILIVMIIVLSSLIIVSAQSNDNVYASGVTPKIKIGISNITKTTPKTNATNPVNNSFRTGVLATFL